MSDVSIVDPTTNKAYYLANPLPTAATNVNYTFSTANGSSAQLGAGATYTGTIEPIVNEQNISVNMISDQPITLTILQFEDAAGLKPLTPIIIPQAADGTIDRGMLINGNYIQVTAKNTGASTTTTFLLNIAYSPLPLAVTQKGNQAIGVAEQCANTYDATQTFVSSSSGNQANASAAATLAAVAGKTNFLTGFDVTAAGATAAGVVTGTITGVLGGTRSFTFAVPAGATVAATPLVVEFLHPLQASAVNTAIVVTLPALGAGNTNATVNAQGFYQ
jgi:hypothetical protein